MNGSSRKNQPAWTNVPYNSQTYERPEQWIIRTLLALNVIIDSIIYIGGNTKREEEDKEVNESDDGSQDDITAVEDYIIVWIVSPVDRMTSITAEGGTRDTTGGFSKTSVSS